MFSQKVLETWNVFKRFFHVIAEDREADIDPSDVIRRIVIFCCVFELILLLVNVLMDGPIIFHGLLSLLSVMALYLLRLSRSPRIIGLFFLSTATVIGMLSLAFSWIRITYYFQWFVPIYVFALLVVGRAFFLVFSALIVGASMVLLAVYGEALISREIANYDDRSFWLLIMNDSASQLVSVALLVLFENFRMRAEWAANAKRVETAKVSHRSAYADMVGHLAHEFNNPLAIIQAASLKMKLIPARTPQTSVSRLQLSAYIRESITRMDDLLNNLLIFARGDDREAKKPVTMKTFLHSIADRFSELCRDRAIELKVSDFTGRRSFLLRTQSLAFAMEKLVQNSIEALTDRVEGRCISIEVSNSDTQLRILVKDNGEGVPIGDEFRIFDPFFSHKTEALTKGLGLSMAKGIIALDGGELYLDRSFDDTCFVMTLPIHE